MIITFELVRYKTEYQSDSNQRRYDIRNNRLCNISKTRSQMRKAPPFPQTTTEMGLFLRITEKRVACTGVWTGTFKNTTKWLLRGSPTVGPTSSPVRLRINWNFVEYDVKEPIHSIPLDLNLFCCCWIYCLTSQSTIFQSYMWRYIDVQVDWIKKLYLKAGSQRHIHLVGFFNVPVEAPARGHPFYVVIPRNRPI